MLTVSFHSEVFFMFHDLPHWAFKLLGSLLGAAVLFLLLSLSHIPSAATGTAS